MMSRLGVPLMEPRNWFAVGFLLAVILSLVAEANEWPGWIFWAGLAIAAALPVVLLLRGVFRRKRRST
jgi:hypothetical protein